MKTRLFALAVAAATVTTALSGCGLSEKEKTVEEFEGRYCSINGMGGKEKTYYDDVDDGIEAAIEDYEDEEDNPRESEIIFDDDEFSMGVNALSGSYYEGEFSLKNGKLAFKYEKCIQNDVEYDIDDEADSRVEKAVIEKMEKLNETETYAIELAPKVSMVDKSVDYAALPLIRQRGYERAEDAEVILKAMGDFLCVDVYGFELDGRYKQGKDFTIEYNPLDAIKDDEFSRINVNDGDYSRIEETISMNLGAVDDYDVTIEFSDGEWEMINDDGDVINEGEYQESDDYEGFIEMYMTEDSPKASKMYLNTMPLFFYINDGEIYYPAFVKVE